MNQLSTTAATRLRHANSYAFTDSFLKQAAITTVLSPGTFVKLNSSGEILPVTALTDIPIGMVLVDPNTTNSVTEKVTIQTFFSAIVIADAEGAITTGDFVAALEHNATKKCSTFTKATKGTHQIVGIALSTAIDEADVKVGILNTPAYQYPTNLVGQATAADVSIAALAGSGAAEASVTLTVTGATTSHKAFLSIVSNEGSGKPVIRSAVVTGADTITVVVANVGGAALSSHDIVFDYFLTLAN